MNGVIDTMRRIARGFRNLDNYRTTRPAHRRRPPTPTHAHL
ncbi:transposase [Kocuria flava]|nr:transposase [Kocuria flava]